MNKNNVPGVGGTGTAVSGSGAGLPKAKQTMLGLYVTSKEAFQMWKADPKNVHILDVRTPEEYIFVGHAAMARNIPIAFIKYQWNADKNVPVLEPNPDFVSKAKEVFKPKDRIFVTCRSGDRSAMAVNALAKAGFENSFNITDGFEGDMDPEPSSSFYGKRMINGWKNSVPWTYDVDPDQLWIADN